LEGPAEIATNDGLLQQRWFFNILPWQEVFETGASLPTACMKNFIEYNALEDVLTNSSRSSGNNSMASLSLLESFLVNLTDTNNTTLLLLQDITIDRFPNITLPQVPTVSNVTRVEDLLGLLQKYLDKCDDVAVQLMELAINTTLQIAENELGISLDSINLGDPLTFNWIRCWDNKILGDPNPWSPTLAQVNASAYQNLFFREQWLSSQQQLFRNYTLERACFNTSDVIARDKCILYAAIDSVKNATGGDQCATNTGGRSRKCIFVTPQLIAFQPSCSFIVCYQLLVGSGLL
jgi:hypothetical protein